MPYSAEISRANPTAFVFLIDQSLSMKEYIAGGNRKSEELAQVINRLLNDLVIRCLKGDEVFDYFDVALIGYGNAAFGVNKVGPVLGNKLQGKWMVPISVLADNPVRIENIKRTQSDPSGKMVEMSIDFPVWLEPVASQDTPMRLALSHAFQLLDDWVANHPDSFPPIVINVTDGNSTDGDPSGEATTLRKLATKDGNVLMFSLHLSSGGGNQIIFPNNPNILPDNFAQVLYTMSSPLPEAWFAMAREMGLQVDNGAHAFVYNSDVAAMSRFLEIGTRQPTQIR